MPQIHPTAIIDPTARLAEDVVVGPYTIVEPNVQVGAGTQIGSHVTLGENLRLGRNVQVFNYACLGTASQDLKHKGEPSSAEIGDGAIVREFVTVNRGTRTGSVTRIGAGAVLLAYSHVAHECVIGEGAVLVNAATLGGEVTIGRRAVIGGLVGVHQFCRIGDFTMIGAGSKVSQDIGPFLIADGHPARPYGPNMVGLRRAGFSDPAITEIRRIYREVFNRDRALDDNLALIATSFAHSQYCSPIMEFCQASERGLARPRSQRRATTESLFERPDPDFVDSQYKI